MCVLLHLPLPLRHPQLLSPHQLLVEVVVDNSIPSDMMTESVDADETTEDVENIETVSASPVVSESLDW